MAYKARWYGREYLKVNTYYESSKICYVCGYQFSNTKNLAVIELVCSKCNTTHDKDINGAKNILKDYIK